MHVSRMTIAGLVAALSFASVSCKEEGPAEKAGRAIDDAAENVEELTGDEGAFEEAGEAADEAVEKTKEAVEDAME